MFNETTAIEMDTYSLANELPDWPIKDLKNLATILNINSSDADLPIEINENIRWLYHSKTKANIGSSICKLKGKVLKEDPTDTEERNDRLYPPPDYINLINGASGKLGVSDKNASIQELELYISHAVIIEALQKMKPRERIEFFNNNIDTEEISKNAGIVGIGMIGPVTTISLLGAAQLSGFGVYLASTTALGFVTNAIGVSLPFAVYTGMTSTIAVVIGPAGWLAAGLWGTWKLLQPEWKKLIPVVLYIASARARHGLSISASKVA